MVFFVIICIYVFSVKKNPQYPDLLHSLLFRIDFVGNDLRVVPFTVAVAEWLGFWNATWAVPYEGV